MKILFVCENYYPHYGGVEVLFKNLTEGLVKKGNRVAVVTSLLPGTKKFEEINGVKIHRARCFNNRYLFSILSIPKVLKLARWADIIQTTTFTGALPAWLGAKVIGKSAVLTVHEVWVGKWKEVTEFSRGKAILHDTLERILYLLPFDKYVCVSNATRKDLLRLNINSNKTVTVYNGFDYDFWNPKNSSKKKVQQLRQEMGLDNKFVCLSWGRPGSSKGFQYLIKAAPYIQQKIPRASILLMLGTPHKYPTNYRRIKKAVAAQKGLVKIIPSLPYQQLGTLIKAADCVIIPSLSEGFGYNALETNSLGTPLVASDAGSLPEVVSGKHLLFKSKDVQDLAEKVALAAKGKVIQTHLKRFEWEDCVEGYLQSYRDLLKRSN